MHLLVASHTCNYSYAGLHFITFMTLTEKIEWRCYWLWSSRRPGVSHWRKLSWRWNSSIFTGKLLWMFDICLLQLLLAFFGSLYRLTAEEISAISWIAFQGVAEINMLYDKLVASYRFGGPSAEWILPLHSSIASADQKKAFLRPPDNIRKVNISSS